MPQRSAFPQAKFECKPFLISIGMWEHIEDIPVLSWTWQGFRRSFLSAGFRTDFTPSYPFPSLHNITPRSGIRSQSEWQPQLKSTFQLIKKVYIMSLIIKPSQ